ncbi:MAG: hypothetical protein GY899_06825 [Verrucomicrobiaceae bacterium]|nr:hypothetical protein [Verrucomicrobiaceae bacterium]
MQNPITKQEADRAIFLDFEGKGPPSSSQDAPPPVMAGSLCDGKYEWKILDENFKDATRKREPTQYLPLENFLKKLKEMAEDQGRRIVYFTSHEKQIFAEHGIDLGGIGFDLKVPVKPKYKTLFKESKKARRQLFDPTTSRTQRNALRKKAFGLCVQCATECAKRNGIEFKVSNSYGFGKVGLWISYREKCKSWTTSAKTKWSWLVDHNETDCRAMELLIKHHRKLS